MGRNSNTNNPINLGKKFQPFSDQEVSEIDLASLGTCVGIISQPENRSVEESDQPDGILSKRKSLITQNLEEPDRVC